MPSQRPRNYYEDNEYLSGIGSGGTLGAGPDRGPVITWLLVPNPANRSGWGEWEVRRETQSAERKTGFRKDVQW